MAHTETTLNSQTIFSGRIIEVKKDDIQLENGKKSIREVVVHHGGVCVAAIDQEDRLLLVRQFRYPYGKELLELPAGKIELGEDPRECGIRELQEGMSCDGCAQNVANALNALDGVWATVTYADHTARVRSKRPIDRGVLEAAVRDAGYYVMTL